MSTQDSPSAHVGKIHSIKRYKAPFDDKVGAIVMKGHEWIEIILSGSGSFDPGNGKFTPIECGHILWHQEGQSTIQRQNRSDPYECLVVQFKWKEGHKPKVVAPRLSFWDDAEQCRSFSSELMEAFHTMDIDHEILSHMVYNTLLLRVQMLHSLRSNDVIPRPLSNLLSIIDLKVAKNISIAEIAKFSRMSIVNRHLKRGQHRHPK